MIPLVALGAAVVLAITVVAIVAGRHTTSDGNSTAVVATPGPTVATSAVTDPTTTTPSPASGTSAALDQVLPTAAELGADWSGGPPQPIGGAPSTWGPCASELWASDTTGVAVNLYWETTAHSTSGNLETSILEASSPAAARAQRGFLASPADIACQRSFVNDDASKRWPLLNQPSAAEWTETPADVVTRLPGDARSFRVTQLTFQGEVTVTYLLIHQFAGPYEASTIATWCSCHPLPVATVDLATEGIAARLVALPGGEGPASLSPIPASPVTTAPALVPPGAPTTTLSLSNIPASSLPTITSVTKDQERGYTRLNEVHISWGQFATAPVWGIQGDAGSAVSPAGPPASTAVDYSSPTGTVRYRALACPNGCDFRTLPPTSVGPGVYGPYVVGPWSGPAQP